MLSGPTYNARPMAQAQKWSETKPSEGHSRPVIRGRM